MKLAPWLVGSLTTLATFAANAADITGDWSATITTPGGRTEYTYAFRQDGARLLGTARSPEGVVTITNGFVNNNTVTFDENVTVQGRRAVLEYTGEVVSATQIRFKRQLLGARFGVVEFVATRAAAP